MDANEEGFFYSTIDSLNDKNNIKFINFEKLNKIMMNADLE